jgi:hypothetical protein
MYSLSSLGPGVGAAIRVGVAGNGIGVGTGFGKSFFRIAGVDDGITGTTKVGGIAVGFGVEEGIVTTGKVEVGGGIVGVGLDVRRLKFGWACWRGSCTPCLSRNT